MATKFTKWLAKFFGLILILLVEFDCSAHGNEQNRIIIQRKDFSLRVLSSDGRELFRCKVGLGRGGWKTKRSMSDLVTPAGKFQVDILLSSQAANCSVAPDLVKHYADDRKAMKFLSSKVGLSQLFNNMNSLDFNSDGKADAAYGYAYIGLTSQTAVTGPKFANFNGVPYWFSIALHGTNDEARNIGRANSGGCVQIPEPFLKHLIEKHLVEPGTPVTIE